MKPREAPANAFGGLPETTFSRKARRCMRLQADAEILKTFIRILRTKVLPGEGVKAEGELAMEAPRQQHVPAQRLEWREEAFNGIGETEADEEQVKDSQYAGSCVPAAPVLLTPHAGGKRPMPTCACER